MKKQELENLDEEDAEDPAILHHTLSKLPDIRLSPPSPLHSPSTTAINTEEDEDLMSNNDDSFSLSTSHLSESIISLSGGEEDEEGDSMDSYSIFSDEMLSDPDVSGPAFSEFLPLHSFNSTPPPIASARSLDGSSQEGEGGNRKPRIVYLDDLISKTLELWETHTLSDIRAEEVLGSKSCIFTWRESLNGNVSDEDADEIARKGIDIVVAEKLEELVKEDEVNSEESEAEKVTVKIADNKKSKKDRSRRRKAEIGIGAVLTLAGVAGVVLAIYGGNVVKEWDYKSFSSKINWSVVA